jgi:succinate dehydrogenase / fumarate reductase flavoprotein subunit
MKLEEFDVVIVGAGLSGLRAGLELSDTYNTAIISKVYPVRSHSINAQGGINAALGNLEEGKDDSPKAHAYDTVKGADFLADQNIAILMCEEAPKTVLEFESMGTPFSRLESGLINQRPFGGAGFPRTCFAGDRTGHALLHTLFQQCVRFNVRFFNEYFLIDLIKVENDITGLIALDITHGELVIFRAQYVILATGGFGRIYKRSTNSIINTGDGVGAAFRIGVPMEDCEFVQFHPTTLYGSNILITEGARGEGGLLFNNKHERFMSKYAPEAMELGPRDIVARAIETEVLEGNAFEDEYVNLDLTHLRADLINKKLPGIREISIHFAGIDPIEEPIPIQPGQHYSMGGIATKYKGDVGETDINGLWVLGECSCLSVHGANRLGGNSLLETAVFGRLIGKKLKERGLPKSISKTMLNKVEEQAFKNVEKLFSKWQNNEGKKPAEIRDKMGSIMNKKVGVFRNEKDMKVALEVLRRLQKEFKDVQVDASDRKFNYGLIRMLELRSMLDIAEVTAYAALWRKESRGAHYRDDFIKRDDKNFLVHSLVSRERDGDLALKTKPVILGIFEVKEREY